MKLKHIFALFALLFAAMTATAQTGQKEVISDSSWITNRAGVFYQARYTVYNNGEESTTLQPLGDTAQTVTRFRDFFTSESNRLAGDAAIVKAYRPVVTELIRLGRSLPNILGKSPYDSLRTTQKNLYDANTWTVRNGTGSTGIRFRQTATGLFQWKSDTATVWRPAAYLGGVIRLNLYGGYTTDFFRKNNADRWTTLDSRYVIQKADQARDLADFTDDPTPAQAPPLADTELRNDGTVRIGEKIMKYNTKKKLWEAK